MHHHQRVPQSPFPTMPTRRDHLRWLAGAIATITLTVYFVLTVAPLSGAPSPTAGETALLIIVPVGVLACAAWTLSALLSCLRRAWRTYRFSHGHPNKAESQALAAVRERQETVSHAQAVARDLAGPQALTLERPWEINIPQDERVLFDGTSAYSRYYGTDAVYTQTSGFFYGKPAFVVAGLGLTAAANRSRRNAALRASMDQWRELQIARYVVTDRRVLVHRLDGQWLTFPFSATTALYPHLEAETLFLEFPDTSPVRIQGPASAVASVVAVWYAHGVDGLLRHPALDPLRA